MYQAAFGLTDRQRVYISAMKGQKSTINEEMCNLWVEDNQGLHHNTANILWYRIVAVKE